jgi:hypothetical protein
LLRKSWDARRKHARSCVVDPTPTAAATVVRGRIWAPTDEFGYLRILFWVPTELLLDTYGLAFGHLRTFIWVPTYQNRIWRSVWTRPGPQHKSSPAAVRSGVSLTIGLHFSQDLDSFIVLFWMSPRGREDFGPSDWDKNGWHEMTKEGRAYC